MIPFPRLAFGLLLGGTALSQNTTVFPSDHATIANGGEQTAGIPVSWGISRMAFVYDDHDLVIPAGRTITALGFRQDGSTASTGHTIQLELRIGPAATASTNTSGTFTNNQAAPPQTVYGPAPFVLPTFTTATSGAPLWVTLTTPYVYTGGNLWVEWVVSGNSNGNTFFSYALDRALAEYPKVQGQQGCLNSANTRGLLQTGNAIVGGSLGTTLNAMPAGSLGILVAELSPLLPPFSLAPLFPGIDPTCQAQVLLGPAGVALGYVAVAGGAGWTWPIPNNLALNDVIVSSQAIGLDPPSPGGVVVSNATQIQIGIQPAASLVRADGPGSTTAAFGNVYTNWSPVTFFQHN